MPPQSPPARIGAMMATVGGQVFLYGGDGGFSDDELDDTWRWDGTT